jgi:osmotically-inducible protein OsmY
MASINQVTRRLERLGRGVTSFARGKVSAVTNRSRGPKPGMDDNTLKNKVETELFRDEQIPKGQINVHVVGGVVELRGEVKRPEIKQDLEDRARSIPEVRDVSNLLHLPKTTPPKQKARPIA